MNPRPIVPSSDTSPLFAVTGATGFIGRAVVQALEAAGHRAVPLSRAKAELNPETDWRPLLEGTHTLIHCAGLAHRTADPEAHRQINHLGTAKLAGDAVAAGMTRLLIISTAGVMGPPRRGQAAPFTDSDTPAPDNPYTAAKLAGEAAFLEAGRQAGVPAIALRPPLVYGASAPGNFASLLKLCALPLPAVSPFAKIANRRSLVSVEHLAGMALAAATHPSPQSGAYLVGEAAPLRTHDIVTALYEGMGKRVNEIRLPEQLLRRGFSLAGQDRFTQALLDDFWLDGSRFAQAFAWQAQTPTGDLLKSCAARYVAQKRNP